MKTDWRHMTTVELYNKFLEESRHFLRLLLDAKDHTELQDIKNRIKRIMHYLNFRKLLEKQ